MECMYTKAPKRTSNTFMPMEIGLPKDVYHYAMIVLKFSHPYRW